MARSVHTTWADLARERHWRGRSAKHRERIAAMRAALATKHRIKKLVKAERRQRAKAPDLPPVPPEGVSIRVEDVGPNVYHAATEEDLRELIARLPDGALTGVSEIVLSLGGSFASEPEDEDEGREGKRDPVTGRLGHEIFPGVWCAHLLGCYHPSAMRITLSAWVLEDELCEPEFTALYLKLCALSTFVHEVAHHQDHTRRVARGRWRADDKYKVESYAEQQELDWTRDVVVPYLEEVHVEDCAALHAWVRQHTGIDVSLEQLAGDPRHTVGEDEIALTFPVSSAFEVLVGSLAKGTDRQSARLAVANELHYGFHFAPALEIVEGVRSEHPSCLEARVLHADVLEHLERYDEAEALARGVLVEDPACDDAWRIISLIGYDLGRWQTVRDAEEARLELEPSGWLREEILRRHARALLELGDHEAVAGEVQVLLRLDCRYTRACAHGLGAIGLLRQGKFEAALEAANAGLRPGEADGTTWVHELRAARFDALSSLGESADPIQPATLECLRARGYSDWADEMAQAQVPGTSSG